MPLRRIALAVVLLFALALLGLFVGIPVTGPRRELASAASRLGVEMPEGRLYLSLGEGLVLEDAVATAVSEGRLYRFELPRVVLELRNGALLTGVAEVRRIRLERPRLELVELDSEPPAVAVVEDSVGWLDVRFATEEVVLSEASVTLTEEGMEPPVALEGVEVVFSELGVAGEASDLLALEGSGTFRARSGALGDVEISEVASEIHLHERKVSLTLLNFRAALAPFVAEMRLELDRSPFGYTVSSLGEPFDPATLVGAAPGSLGEASLLLEVFGRGPTPAGFRAQGSVTLPGGELGEVPLLEAIDDAVEGDVFSAGSALEPAIAVYRVRDGYVLFEPFELRVGENVAAFRGRASLDGRLELEVDVEGESGRTPLLVAGTVERPVARPR